MDKLEALLPFMHFLQNVSVVDTEIVLCDAISEKIYHVINPFDEHTYKGADMSSQDKEFVRKKLFADTDYIVNYRALSASKHKTKSISYFYKENSSLYAILTVNIKVDRLIELRDILNDVVAGTHHPDGSKSLYNIFDMPLDRMMTDKIMVEIGRLDLPPDRLSYDERMNLMRRLDEQGVFAVKGAVSELAVIMKTTETSIYRYLNKLEAEKDN